MLALYVLLICQAASGSLAWYNVQCSDQAAETATMEPAKDGVKGRYVVQYCTSSSPPLKKWYLELHTFDKPPENCSYNVLGEDHNGMQHSSNVELINTATVNTSCPFVCLSQPLDLIFQSCYQLSNQVMREGTSKLKTRYSEKLTTYLYIGNNIARYSKNNTSAFEECIEYQEKTVCTWLEGVIPYTSYSVFLLPFTGSEESDWSAVVTDNCTRVGGARGAVRCELRAAPGRYIVELRHTAPWARGLPDLVHHRGYFNVSETTPLLEVEVGGVRGAVWGASGAALLLAASLLAGLLVYQKRQDAKKKIKIWQDWLTSKSEAGVGVGVGGGAGAGCGAGGGRGPVLLLYARDCPPAQRAAHALARLLRAHHCGEVLDLYSPEVVARAAAAPAAFVRACMSAPSVRVLLLQTPALAALHALRADHDALALEEPLLARRVVYRAPVFGDSLLQLALQLLAEGAHTQPGSPYRKYFLATFSELAVDIFPAVVPFTRFELPAAAPALLRALRGEGPGEGQEQGEGAGQGAVRGEEGECSAALEALAAASAELAQFVLRDNPNYLAEQLLFL